MKEIHPVFSLWASFFPFFSVNKQSQNILGFFKLTFCETSFKNATPQSIDPDALTVALNSVLPVIKLKDGKTQPIAAQRGKKNKYLYERIEKNNPAVADNLPADNVIKNNHQSITTNNKQV
jgi:hypothetical protein